MTREDTTLSEKAIEVFCDYVIAQVDDENKELQNSQNKQLQRSLATLQSVKIQFGNDMISLDLSQGYMSYDDFFDSWEIPIHEIGPFPLGSLADTNRIGGLSISGIECDLLHYQSSLGNPLSTRMEDEGTVHMEIFLTGNLSLKGKLENLSERALSYADNECFFFQHCLWVVLSGRRVNAAPAHLSFLEDENIENATFAVKAVTLSVDLQLQQKTLDIIADSPPGEVVDSESDKLRHSAAALIVGSSNADALLEENKRLKLENSKLLAAHNLLHTIEVRHQEGSLCLNIFTNADEPDDPLWRVIDLSNKEEAIIPASNLMDVRIFVSGIPIGIGQDITNPRLFLQHGKPYLALSFSPQVRVIGLLDFGDHPQEEQEFRQAHTEIFEENAVDGHPFGDFHQFVQRQCDQPFCELRLVEINIKKSAIEHLSVY